MEVIVENVTPENLKESVQSAKDAGRRVLALSPSKVLRGKVTEYVLVTQ